MSSGLRDSIEEHKNIGRDIQAFLWTGKPYKSPRREHTPEEYQAFLEQLHRRTWYAYDEGAGYLGWKNNTH